MFSHEIPACNRGAVSPAESKQAKVPLAESEHQKAPTAESEQENVPR
jgi:hypothetical protein